MSDSLEKPWSNNSNAPRISSGLYIEEKNVFAGSLVGAILHGIVIALFFQCISALVDPINNVRRSIKWGLIAHTTALFLFSTVHVAMELYMVSTDFIDGRNFSGTNGLPPGPLGHDSIFNNDTKVLAIYDFAFPLNQWLADGLLLYRCYVIYSKNYRALVFPCLLYAASFVTGIARMCISSSPTSSNATVVNVDTSYYSICLSLNLLLTLMIIGRLLLHSRNVQRAIGTTGLYTPVVTMLVESCALYAIALLLYIIPLALGSLALDFLSQMLGPIQVIAPYLIVLRVAKGRELTNKTITVGSAGIGSIRFKSQGTTDDDTTLPCGSLTSPTR